MSHFKAIAPLLAVATLASLSAAAADCPAPARVHCYMTNENITIGIALNRIDSSCSEGSARYSTLAKVVNVSGNREWNYKSDNVVLGYTGNFYTFSTAIETAGETPVLYVRTRFQNAEGTLLVNDKKAGFTIDNVDALNCDTF